MSRDPSLKTKGKLVSQRSVMTRAERVQKMIRDGRLDPKNDRALGLPKTLVPRA